jgi:hypothetical protein
MWLGIPVVGASLLIWMLALLVIWILRAPDREQQTAVDNADHLDPGWTLDELESKRKDLPDEQNAAIRVLAARKLLPDHWLSDAETMIDDLPPEVQLNAKQTAHLREDLRQAADALTEARKLAGLPEGRYPITYTPDYASTTLLCLDAREVAHLLKLDAALPAQDGDIDGALVSIRAALNAGRSIGDEPISNSQLLRIHLRRMARNSLERTLAQGQPSADAMAILQELLEDEDGQLLFLFAARGERAGVHKLMLALESREVSLLDLPRDLSYVKPATEATEFNKLPSTHAWLLLYMNECVEFAKLEPWQREQHFVKLDAMRSDLIRKEVAPTALVFLPPMRKVSTADLRSLGQLRCAIAAVAAERYRIENNCWPDSLAVLETKQLKKVPLDPYDGKPLRYRRLADGAIVYSVGPDHADDGGNIDRKNPTAPGTDIGFRLWNPDKRSQPSK